MTLNTHQFWFGLGGVPPHDNPRALAAQERLHWPMICVALLALPALYLDLYIADPTLQRAGKILTIMIFLAFFGELLLMLVLTRHRSRYLLRNWLGLIIVIGSGLAVLDSQGEFFPLLRTLRLAVVGIILLRTIRMLRNVVSPQALPYILGLGAILLALAGAGFYWLEPSVHSYAEGLWLAFTTGATVGYGDFVPTTWPARFFAVMMVFLGYALMSVATASIAAIFIGEDERVLRREMHADMKRLHEEVRQLREELERYERRQPWRGEPGKHLPEEHEPRE